jgi:hypothetical protein
MVISLALYGVTGTQLALIFDRGLTPANRLRGWQCSVEGLHGTQDRSLGPSKRK